MFLCFCVFLFMCWIPFDCSHIPDQAVFFVNSCLIKICKVVIFLQRLHKHEIRLEHVFEEVDGGRPVRQNRKSL